MKKIIILIVIVLIPLFFQCLYQTPYKESVGMDLIRRLDLQVNWQVEKGIILSDMTGSMPPPSGFSNSYYLSFQNLITNGNFESSNVSPPINWTGSTITGFSRAPQVFELKTNGLMSGNNYMHIYLDRDVVPVPEFVFTTFPSEADNNYVLRFDCQYLSGGTDLLYSYGVGSDDNTNHMPIHINSTVGLTVTVVETFPCFVTNNLYQIRFGYKDPVLATNMELNIDNVALFIKSNHYISTKLNIENSGYNVGNDNTGEKFYEGVYKLTVKAKADTLNKMTLRLGASIKEYTLTSDWQDYNLEAQILHEDNFILLAVMPTVVLESSRVPGGIYITKPTLYYYPDKATPEN